MSRGGYGGGRGGAGARGKLKIAGVDCEWDIKGLVVKTTPAEKFPKQPPPRQPPPTDDEKILCQRYRALRDRIHDGPLYTVLGDGIKAGEKRKADGPPPTAEALFDPFTGTETYSAKYRKVRRRMPKLDTRPYVVTLFPEQLRSILGDGILEPAAKKQKVLQISKATAMTKLERLQVEIENQEAQRQEDERAEEEAAEEAEDEDEEDKPDAVEEDDNWSAVSSDSEDADDDYNAEQYFDNGEDDYGIEDGGHDDNYYE